MYVKVRQSLILKVFTYCSASLCRIRFIYHFLP
jgi:hypothetical protein